MSHLPDEDIPLDCECEVCKRANIQVDVELIELKTEHPELTDQDLDEIMAVQLAHLVNGGDAVCSCCNEPFTISCFYEPWKKLKKKYLDEGKL